MLNEIDDPFVTSPIDQNQRKREKKELSKREEK
jgi:hypothetical protein